LTLHAEPAFQRSWHSGPPGPPVARPFSPPGGLAALHRWTGKQRHSPARGSAARRSADRPVLRDLATRRLPERSPCWACPPPPSPSRWHARTSSFSRRANPCRRVPRHSVHVCSSRHSIQCAASCWPPPPLVFVGEIFRRPAGWLGLLRSTEPALAACHAAAGRLGGSALWARGRGLVFALLLLDTLPAWPGPASLGLGCAFYWACGHWPPCSSRQYGLICCHYGPPGFSAMDAAGRFLLPSILLGAAGLARLSPSWSLACRIRTLTLRYFTASLYSSDCSALR